MVKQCRLVLPGPSDEKAVDALISGWRSFGGRMNPGLLRQYRGDYGAWLMLLRDWDCGIGIGEEVPQTLYLLKDEDGNIIGATAIRHYLNHTNIADGGHIAYGIAPEHRGQGYGSLVLKLALGKMREMGIDQALVTCDADNELSRRVILKCGGVLENRTTDENGVLVERYWIDNR